MKKPEKNPTNFGSYKLVNLADLIPYEKNARTHSKIQIEQIKNSITEFGFTNPILIDENNNLIAGHGRLQAAKSLKLKELPAVVLTGLTDPQKRALILADNKIAVNAGWDEQLLRDELELLKEADYDLLLTGFSDDEINDLLKIEKIEGLTDEDEVPEVQENPISKLGDIWVLGNHKLMCGDSTSITDVEKLMGGGMADMVFTDPPYGINIVSNDGSVGGGTKGKYKKVLNDETTNVAVECFNLVKNIFKIPQLFFWGANHYSSNLPDSSCWIVWDKQGGKSVTFADCELCYTNLKKPVRMFTHIWDGFRRDSEKNEMRVHPTQKPVKLFEEIFEKFKSPNSILDLFGGSGSTLIACEKTNRSCFMMELDPKYCDVIIKRWQGFTGNEAIHAETQLTYNSYEKTKASK